MRYSLLLWFILAFAINAVAQSSVLYGTEKAYLHTDRTQYVAGDTIWFNSTLFDAATHQLSTLSETVYVAFLDSKQIITEAKLKTKAGQRAGFVAIPEKQTAGTYQLVAHTNLMRNQDEAFFFRKSLNVLAINTKPEFTAIPADWDVQFFAEGGNLVNGLTSKVAFKAIDQTGKGIDVVGIIENKNGERISDFKTAYLGMGAFTLTPQPDQTYYARVTHEGQQRRFALPTALSLGYSLTVDNVMTRQNVKIWINTNKSGKNPLTVVAKMRGQVLAETKLPVGQSSYALELPYTTIPLDGVLQLTLFDDQMPVCERLVFVHRNRQLRFRLATQRENPGPNDTVTTDIMATDAAGLPVEAIFSLAVTDSEQDAVDVNTPNLPAYLLLTSDLKGAIEQPNQYFETDSLKARFYLDNLMLTQGWRRFTAPESESQPLSFEVEKELVLAGRAYIESAYRVRDKPLVNEPLRLTTWDKSGLHVFLTKTDEKGHFELGTNLLDSVRIIALDAKGRDVRLSFVQFTPRFLLLPAFTGTIPNKALSSRLLENSLLQKEAIQLKEVDVKAARIDPLQDDSRRNLYFGKPDRVLEVSKDKSTASYSTVEDLLTGRIAGVRVERVVKSGGIVESVIVGASILLDGAPVPLESIRPQDIDQIDIINDPGRKFLNILTKRGSGTDVATLAEKPIQKWLGYAATREFYNPKYSLPLSSHLPDRRATLYWNPSVKTDKDGRATVTFYNSDTAKKWNIIIQGTDSMGSVGSLQKVLK